MDFRKSILLTRLQNNGNMSLSQYINEFNVSVRTVKTEINDLNEQLGEALIHIHQDTIFVSDEDKLKQRSQLLLKKTSLVTYKLSRNERHILEFLMLLFAENYVTVNDICDRLMVSRGTVLSDLRELKHNLAAEHLALFSKTNHGFRVKGDEAILRQYALKQICNHPLRTDSFLVKQMDSLVFAGIDVDDFSRELIDYADLNRIEMTDEVFQEALVYLCISVKRIIMNPTHSGTLPGSDGSLLERCVRHTVPGYQLSSTQKAMVEKQLQVILENRNPESKSADEQIKISSFIWKVCQDFDIISLFGYENYRNLFNHIELTIQYIKDKKEVSINPFCKELKKKYEEIFRSIELNIDSIQDLVDRRIEENDISYIAMHIATVIEGRKQDKTALSAVIVCPTGRCVSLLLKARVMKYFNITISDILPSYKVNDSLNVDFIISTVPLASVGIPVVHVNQMLSQVDIDKLEIQIEKMSLLNEQKEIISDIERYLEEYMAITQESDDFGSHLHQLNKKYEPLDNGHDLFFYKALRDENMILDSEVSDWESAIRQSGELLLKDESLTPEYIHKMIELVQENGPYIVFSPGFVIAHAGPEDGAKQLGVSLVRTQTPIDVLDNEIKVRLIVCLSIPDKTSHVFLLFQIYKCLCNPDIFRYLLNAGTKDEFKTILKIFELRSEDVK